MDITTFDKIEDDPMVRKTWREYSRATIEMYQLGLVTIDEWITLNNWGWYGLQSL